MSDTPAITETASSADVSLVRGLLVLATGLLVAWCVQRVKPALWFGALFGLLTGAIAVGLERWFGQRPGRGSAVLAIVCASVGCAAVFGISIRLTERAATHDPKQAAAEVLLRSMEQGQPLPNGESSPPELIRPTWISGADRYLAVRYRNYAQPGWWWLAAEIVSAGLTAGIVHRLMNLRRRSVAEAAP